MQPYVEATLKYIDPACEGGVLYELEQAQSTLVVDPRRMRVHDARKAGEAFSLDRHGFQLVHCPIEFDVHDPQQLAAVYRPRMRAMVRTMTGASRVLLFGEMIRSEADPGASKPSFNVHLDFDERTLRDVVRAIHPDAEPLLKKRFALINLWRPIRPVERSPLAVCDASTVSREDLRTGYIRMRPSEPAGMPLSGYNVAYSSAHRWWYFPDMQPDEVLMFKLVDSDPDAVQFTAHVAFEDPAARPDAAPRQSIESRMIAFFD